MKKFHGKRVPKPRMKKMIHTALYLGKRQEEVHINEVIQLNINKQLRTIYLLGIKIDTGKKILIVVSFSYLSRGALMAVMVAFIEWETRV